MHAIGSKENGGVAGPQLVLTAPTAVIPEPMTVGAIALAIAGLGGYIRKRKTL